MIEQQDEIQKILDDEARKERQTEKKDIWKNSPYPPLPKHKVFTVYKKEFVEYTDGDKYVFKIVSVEPGKYRIGFAFKNAPEVIVGVLPRQFSPHIKRQYYRSLEYLSKIFCNIAKDRGWQEFHE